MATYDLTSVSMPTTLEMGDILNCPYTGDKVSITLPAGRYFLECWGAQGGYRSSTEYGGKGGYSKGVLTLEEATEVFLYAGGKGGTSSSASNNVVSGGFNGGGYRYSYSGGGGASDIRIGTDSLYARVIVAGGGGSDGSGAEKEGGAGGGISGQTTPATNYGTGGLGGQSTYSGTDASTTVTTQATSGLNTSNTSLTYGGFGFGGAGLFVNDGYGGAGGGGWYGGQGTLPDTSGDDDKGGGGGSGFVYTKDTVSSIPIGYLLSGKYYLTHAETKQGTDSFVDPNNETEIGHSGDGYIRITVGENINDLRRRKSARIQQKGNSSTEWNPDTILLSREIGIETDTNKMKIGDGITPWSLLPYFNSSASVSDEVIKRIKYYGDPDVIPSDESYFTVNDTGETITGLTDTGKTQTELVIPYKINGIEITRLSRDVPNNVTSILDGAIDKITKVVIPNSVTNIGDYAFNECSALTDIKMSDNITILETSAFNGCSALENIDLPDSIQTIGSSAFSSCTSLKSINIPNSVTSIGQGAFDSCSSLTSINIPNGVTGFDDCTFMVCTSLTSINIPNSVTRIGVAVFEGCTDLTIYCEQGSYAETYAKENNIPVIYTDIAQTPKYNTLNLNEAASNVVNGLAQFSLKGLVEPCQHAPYHGNVKNKYAPLQHTIGVLSIFNGTDLVSKIDVELYGRNSDSTYGFAEAKDELTEKGFKRVWSKDFFITSSYEYSTEIASNNSNNRIHIFTIPETAFGDELPKKNGIIEPICNFAYPCTKEFIYNYTNDITIDYYSGYYVAMEYIESNGVYKIYFLTNKYATKSTLLNTKLFIIYELNTPIYDNHTNKIYVKDGYKITFDQTSVEIITTVKSTRPISYVPLTSNIQVPVNNAAVMLGFEQTYLNINDLNHRIENVEISGGSIGAADGVTDDSEAIQNLINNAETTSGLITDIVIPEGKYALGKSLELTKSNLRLIGNGNVIFKPTGNFPAIKIYRPSSTGVSDITVENINIHLPNTAYLDGGFEGSHSGIYIDGSYAEYRGLYRITVKDVTVNGAYRYAWQNTDKSYAIYCKDNTIADTYAYFCNFENINAFSVYCGLYLGEKVNCSNVSNFHWDKNDVNGYDGGVIATMGVAYGIICNSYANTIDFRGQSIGDDSGSWCYKDYNDNQYTLAEVIGAENVNTVNNIDYFKSGYTMNFHEQIVVDGKNVDVFLGRNNLSKIGILCRGGYNTFSGFIYDPQRSDYQYVFTASSAQNRYYYPTADIMCGTTHTYTSFIVDLYGTGTKNDYCVLNINVIKDLGYENVCVDAVLSQKESFVSDNFIGGADEETVTVAHSKHFGMQDNALAYADKFSSINVYQSDGNTQTSVTVGGVEANQVIGQVFDPKSSNVGFRNGITFDQSPEYNNPIYIDIEFNEGHNISYISRFGIQFNNYIAESFDVLVLKDGTTDYTNIGINSKFLKNTSPHATLLAYVVASNGEVKTWENIKGIRIIIRQAYNTAVYNTEKKVGISLIWATDANHGGNAWLPRGGGEMYGNVNMNSNRISNLSTPENDNDAATKAYIDEKIQNFDIRPDIKDTIDTISVNTIYDLGVQTSLSLTLPSGTVGDFIQVEFISIDTPTTLTITSTNGLNGYDLTPETNKIYTLYFDWGAIGYDSNTVTYGWRYNYSEYSINN